ncbi:GntR family transcriptional regulator [Crateriforma conspicua]|uniref:HTH-type transcriptional regulator McbR n=1 Tax=Crateriforma conspicua TaxID=2527996 RepID=A0A5C5XRK1_9PLAN|nr:GntR family transcriptional regulator [Crateriforma conspicua]QDV66135.1 HTH-type transcriptional regulator McbR [Crateriforma conspicua]TWT65520.1 HTH-type transcriptional regulator McbR [Crateriforma conspicua]
MGSLPRTIREQVTNEIRDQLVTGQFPAGTTLRETDLAERFGVSRGPIRDAFLQLSNEGFLTYQANRGVTVRHPPDPEDRELITSLRKQLETHVIQKGLGDLTDAQITKIKDALDHLQSACEQGDVARIARRDIQFHEAFLTACGGEDLLPAWRHLCSRMLLTYTRLTDYMKVFHEHVVIFDALQDRKKAAAITAIKANIR